MKNKKGNYGLNTVVTVTLALFILLLVSIAIIVGASVLQTPTIFPVTSYSAVNESVTSSKTAGLSATLTAGGLRGGSCGTITSVINGTNAVVIPLNTFTQTGCSVVNASSMVSWGTTLFFNYPYTAYSNSYNAVNSMNSNLTNAIANFFGNSSTFFAILAVVVIMIFLGLMIGAVYLFSQGRREGGL